MCVLDVFAHCFYDVGCRNIFCACAVDLENNSGPSAMPTTAHSHIIIVVVGGGFAVQGIIIVWNSVVTSSHRCGGLKATFFRRRGAFWMVMFERLDTYSGVLTHLAVTENVFELVPNPAIAVARRSDRRMRMQCVISIYIPGLRVWIIWSNLTCETICDSREHFEISM